MFRIYGILSSSSSSCRFHPDVVVASSFGGAVAVSLMSAGWLDVPTVLLAPAQGKLASIQGTPAPRLGPKTSGIVVVHAPCDATISFADSFKLVDTAGRPEHCTLVTLRDPTGHKMKSFSVARIREWVASAQSLHQGNQ